MDKWGYNRDLSGGSEASEIAYVRLAPLGLCFMYLTMGAGQGLSRLVIGVQLVKVGYELPKRYISERALELLICLLPLMTISWLVCAGCVMLLVPKISFVWPPLPWHTDKRLKVK